MTYGGRTPEEAGLQSFTKRTRCFLRSATGTTGCVPTPRARHTRLQRAAPGTWAAVARCGSGGAWTCGTAPGPARAAPRRRLMRMRTASRCAATPRAGARARSGCGTCSPAAASGLTRLRARWWRCLPRPKASPSCLMRCGGEASPRCASAPSWRCAASGGIALTCGRRWSPGTRPRGGAQRRCRWDSWRSRSRTTPRARACAATWTQRSPRSCALRACRCCAPPPFSTCSRLSPPSTCRRVPPNRAPGPAQSSIKNHG